MPLRARDRRTDPGVALSTVAIVGRPNVGKSTLFNRIVGQRIAIVAPRPGVTRDRQFAEADWNGRSFLLADTGGVMDVAEEQIDRGIREQVLAAIDAADVILFVVDGRDGLTPVDEHIAHLLRRSGREIVVAVNKLDEPATAVAQHDFHALGLGEPHPVSALSGKGSGDLLDAVLDKLPPTEVGEAEDVSMRLAVIGKPNVGKSSFVNRLLGEDRVLVDNVAGTTRDAIDTYLEYEGERICLIDTAGLRRQSRVEDEVEFYSRLRAAAAIRRAQVCLLVVDSHAGVTSQDFRIGQEAWDEGCGLILVANKWDLIPDRGPDIVAAFKKELRERAEYLRWVPIVTTSALTGKRVRKLLDMAREVHEERGRRIQTADVNRVLQKLVAAHNPPQGSGGEVKLLYGSQVSTAPPVFIIWCNRPKDIADSYVRYLANGFRREWGFTGTPIRLRLRERGGK
ncbi:MAG: ribosome biogenesis GTPase Der [Gemmatimonadota bacterium]